MLSTSGALVYAETESPAVCLQCRGAMHVRKTLRRKGQTLEHGAFLVSETILVCAVGCTTEVPSLAGGSERIAVIQRSGALARLLLPRRTVGYDVMAFVGLQRFVHHRQRDEIRAALDADYGIRLSTGEVSTLAQDFVVYLEALHQKRAPALRDALAKDGGWPMHIDATGENGKGTMLTVYAGWRGWVLGSWKIPTERADAVLPRLHKVAEQFGDPCAIMRDLGRAMIEASGTFVRERKLDIPILGCHFHFLRDVGKDLLAESHDQLRALFRRFEVKSRLRSLTRDLGRQLGSDIAAARTELARWLALTDESYELGTGDAGLAVVRALAQWVLDYQADGHDEGLPFGRPYLDLWRRCSTALRAVEAFLRVPSDDTKVQKALERLHLVIAPVRTQLPFQRPAAALEARARLFDELRQALRIQSKPVAGPPEAPSTPKALGELRDIQRAVEKLTVSLRGRRPGRGPAQDTRKAIDLILDHLKRHGPSLWGHAIPVPKASGAPTRLVERTNMLLEAFFGNLKHGERRRSGRKTLTQDLENFPGAAPLAANLTKPDYVEILCNSLAQLPRAFATLDEEDRRLALPHRKRTNPDNTGDIESASLPTADRNLIRSKELRQMVQAAARSRAPRLTPDNRHVAKQAVP